MQPLFKGFLLAALLLAIPGVSSAIQINQGIGIDLIRWSNPHQDKMANIFYQRRWGMNSDWVIGYARSSNAGDRWRRWHSTSYKDYSVYDVSVKAYRSQMREGVYGQLGIVHYDKDYMHPNLDSSGETGLLMALGYEAKLARNLAAIFAVKGVAGIPAHRNDEDSDTFFFEPSGSLIFMF